MYKLMIVEDEPLIRAGLKHYFNWNELGIQAIVEAENGKQGIETALNEHPDLVITDIRMPEVDGLEMIEQLRQQLPDTIFVILTGYNEFQYAQRAIHTGGVYKYLLKPLQYEESLETVEQCMAIIKKRKNEHQERIKLEREIQENVQYKSSQIVKLVLEEDTLIDKQAIERLLPFKYDAYLYQPIAAACIPASFSSKLSATSMFKQTERAIEDALRKLLRPGANMKLLTYFSKTKMYAIAIYGLHDLISCDAIIEKEMNDLLRRMGSEAQASLFLALGSPLAEWSKLGNQLRHSEKTLHERFFTQKQYLFISGNAARDNRQERAVQLSEIDKQAITACLENGNAAETCQLMQQLAHTASRGTPDKLLAYMQELIGVTIRFATQHEIQIDGVYSDRLFSLSCLDDFHTIEQLLDWIGSWMLHLNRVYLEKKENSDDLQADRLFKQIELYIYEHIDQEVTLQMVADRFFYNPSYLSRLFKNKLNKNYLSFVTEIRMQYARKCLAQPQILIAEVCRMCGYKSYKHFVKTFKSVTRMTPTEFRKQLGLSWHE